MYIKNRKNFVRYSVADGIVPHKQRGKIVSKRHMIVTGVVALAVFGIAQILSAPSHGHVTHTGGPIVKQSVQPPAVFEAPSSKNQNSYYSLTLPAGYKPQSDGQPMAGLVYQQTIIKQSATGSQIIAIGIVDAPGGLTNLSSYQLRQQAPSHYTKTNKSVNGEQVIIFADTQSPSVVAFWQHQGRVATIGATAGVAEISDDGTKTQQAALQPVLDGWQWR
jgi:hypothetical protein